MTHSTLLSPVYRLMYTGSVSHLSASSVSPRRVRALLSLLGARDAPRTGAEARLEEAEKGEYGVSGASEAPRLGTAPTLRDTYGDTGGSA